MIFYFIYFHLDLCIVYLAVCVVYLDFRFYLDLIVFLFYLDLDLFYFSVFFIYLVLWFLFRFV